MSTRRGLCSGTSTTPSSNQASCFYTPSGRSRTPPSPCNPPAAGSAGVRSELFATTPNTTAAKHHSSTHQQPEGADDAANITVYTEGARGRAEVVLLTDQF